MAERKKLGELLIEGGLIDQYQLKSALAHQRQWGGRIGANVVKLGFVTEEQLVRFLSHAFSLPSVNLHAVRVPPPVIACVPKDVAKKYGIIPLKHLAEKKQLVIAMSDPTNLLALDELNFLVNARVQPVISSDTGIEDALRHYYDKSVRMEFQPNSPLSNDLDYSQLAPAPTSQVKAQSVRGKIDLSSDEEVVVGDAADEPTADFSQLDDDGTLDDVLVFSGGAEKTISLGEKAEGRPELSVARAPAPSPAPAAPKIAVAPPPKKDGAPSTDQLVMALVRVLIDKGLLTKEELLARLNK